MANQDPRDWMWSEALRMLARADRLHRQVFQPPQSPRRGVSWEPPVDVLETHDAVLILVALPGVDVEKVEVVLHNGGLSIAGERLPPEELATATIHRLELPQGRFERHVALPPGRYEAPQSGVANGCLMIRLPKAGGQRGGP
ncbi:MAG: Hsp20/alpha crystallin family protein [Alphaproteobacteria bacterium]|nr:Hsp20/alpha crystallin family protein [Alphaproteobacteria bacterium]